MIFTIMAYYAHTCTTEEIICLHLKVRNSERKSNFRVLTRTTLVYTTLTKDNLMSPQKIWLQDLRIKESSTRRHPWNLPWFQKRLRIKSLLGPVMERMTLWQTIRTTRALQTTTCLIMLRLLWTNLYHSEVQQDLARLLIVMAIKSMHILLFILFFL